MKWVRLMLVCRHWRNIGLSSPWLWRRIILTGDPNSLQYRLSRAAGCTIDVFLSKSATTNESVMPLLLPFASSIRSIHTCDSFHFDTLASINPLLAVSLPSLESLMLLPEDAVGVPEEDDESGVSEEWYDLGLSARFLPRLRKLAVRRIAIPGPLEIFTELRELSINMGNHKYPPLFPQTVVEILAHAPRLEALKLVSWPTWDYQPGFRVSTNAGPDGQPRCHLPYLREVSLSCPYHFSAEILQAINAPDLCLFRAEVFVGTPVLADDIGGNIFPPSLRHFVYRLTSLRIVPTKTSGFYICGTASLAPRRSRHNLDCFWVEISVQDHTEFGSIDSLDAALTTACTALAGAPLTRLNIANFETDDPPPALWHRLGTTFPAIDTLRVACSPPVAVSFLESFVALSMEGAWSALRHLNISTESQRCFPLDSCDLHDIFVFVLKALRARRERDVEIVLGLEHAMMSSTPLAAHRWMLYEISSLCGGQFAFRRRDGHYGHFQVDLLNLFGPTEWRMLSLGEDASSEMTGPSGKAHKCAVQIEDSVDLKVANKETAINGGLPSDDNGTDDQYVEAGAGDDSQRDEYWVSITYCRRFGMY